MPAPAGLGGPLTGYVGPFPAALVHVSAAGVWCRFKFSPARTTFAPGGPVRAGLHDLHDAAAGADLVQDPTQFFEIPGGALAIR